MIDKAQLCINNLLCCSDVFNFNRELERLFRCIPRKMNQVADFQANSTSQFNAIIQREQDLLDALESSDENSKKVKNCKKRLKQVNVKIKVGT